MLRAIFEALKSDAKKNSIYFFLLSTGIKWVKWGYFAKASHIFLLLFIWTTRFFISNAIFQLNLSVA